MYFSKFQVVNSCLYMYTPPFIQNMRTEVNFNWQKAIDFVGVTVQKQSSYEGIKTENNLHIHG